MWFFSSWLLRFFISPILLHRRHTQAHTTTHDEIHHHPSCLPILLPLTHTHTPMQASPLNRFKSFSFWLPIFKWFSSSPHRIVFFFPRIPCKKSKVNTAKRNRICDDSLTFLSTRASTSLRFHDLLLMSLLPKRFTELGNEKFLLRFIFVAALTVQHFERLSPFVVLQQVSSTPSTMRRQSNECLK